ncbi:MAG: hypothetical protein A2539_06125 [Elusimicrobia bacterium RIFOXYD2_FULL_34_15]|nr:MAG: hypothetical protein A2539_06125 [Elusimicrobia bacterium RIFOXYD2_FULL_34_15]
MKKVTLLVSVVVFLAIGLYLFVRLEIFTSSLKYLIQSQLTTMTGKQTKIEKVVWVPFNKLILKKVSFTGFSCDETVITVNLKKINKGVNAIEKITLNEPQIDYLKIEEIFKSKVTKSEAKPQLNLPPINISLNEGKVSFNSFDIKNVFIEIVPKKTIFALKLGFSAVSKGTDEFSGGLKLAGTANKNLSEIKLKGEIKDIVYKKLKPLNGKINIKGNIDKLDMIGDISSEEATVVIRSNIIPQNEQVKFYTTGNIYNIRTITDLLNNTTTQYNAEGPLSFDGYFELPDKKLNISLTQPYLKTLGNLDIKNIRTNLAYNENEWLVTSSATILSGIVLLEGKIQKNNVDFALSANDLSIKSDYNSGTLSFYIRIAGDSAKPKIAGNVKINKFRLSQNIPEDIYGEFNWVHDTGRLKLRGKNISIYAEANKSKILNCRIKYNDANITLSGKYEKITFNANNIDASFFDERFSGLIDCTGSILNALSEKPILNAKFLSPQITINNNSGSLSGEILYSKDNININNLTLDGLVGNIKILPNKGETSGNLNLTKCNSAFILPFIGIKPEILSGSISGKINWDGSLKDPKPFGTIVITRGNILKDIPYELIVTSFESKFSKLIISEFAVQQKASKTCLKLSGEIEKNNFNLSLKLNDLEIQKKIVNGDLSLYGKKTENTINYKITSPNLSVDNVREKFLTTGTYDGKKIDLKEIIWGDKIRGNFSYFLDSRYVSSNIKFLINAEEIYKKIDGRLIGEMSVRGDINNPLISINYRYEGNIYGLDSHGTGKISVNKKILKVENTKLIMDKSVIAISGTADLGKGEFTGLNISADDLKTDSIYTLYGATFPVSGKFKDVEFNITGPLKNPEILVSFSGTNIHIKEKLVDSLDGRFTYKNKRVVFSKGNIKWDETQIKILPESNINISKESIFKIVMELRNVKIPGVILFGGLSIEGSWDNSIKADISTSGLWVNQYQLKDRRYHVEYSGGILSFIPEMGKTTQVVGRMDISKLSELKIDNVSIFEVGKKIFFVNGLLKNDTFDIVSEGNNIPLGNLLNILGAKIEAAGNTNFNISISGTRENPILNCMVNSSNGELENIDFDTASIFFEINESILELKHLKISQKNVYSVEGEGTLPLPLTAEMKKKLSDRPIDISLKIKDGDMSILTSFSKVVKKATGKFSMSIDVRGNIKKPDISGELNATAEEVVMKDIFKKLNDVKCKLKFSGNRIELNEVSALIDKEPIVISGYLSVVDGFNIGDFDLHVVTPNGNIGVVINDLQIKSGGIGKIIPGVPDASFSNPSRAKVGCDITFAGTSDSWNISGYMKLSDARFTYPGVDSSEGSWDFLNNASWNFKIISGKNCWYENDFASAETKGELLLHGKGSSPFVTGKVESTRGDINYIGRSFTIREAIFEAENSNLYLSGIAESETEIEKRREDLATHQMVTEYIPDTIVLTLDRGPLENVKPRFSSKTNPQEEEQSAAQAALGLADTKQKQPFSAEEVSKAVDTLLTTPFVKSLFKRTGFIDKFAIKREAPATPLAGGTQPTILDLYKGTKLQFGKSFSSGFSAGYGVKFDEFENKLSLRHDIELSYRLKNGVMFKTTQELDGQRNRSFFFEKFWRFGTEPSKEAPRESNQEEKP